MLATMTRMSDGTSDPESPEDSGETRKVLIAGAGPAGLTAAYELCKRGAPLEKVWI